MNKMFALFSLILLIASAAHAEFTPTEKQEVLQQVIAIHDAGHAAYFLSRHLTPHPEDLAPAAEALLDLLAVKEQHFSGLMYLLDQEGTLAHTIGSMTRAESRQAGLDLIANASYTDVLAQVGSLVSGCSGACGDVTTARNLLNNVESRRVDLDATLPYLEPRLDENLAMPGATREESANAGPHGDYRRYGQKLRALERSQNKQWVDAIQSAVAEPAYLPTYILNTNSIGRAARYRAILAGLVVGAEHPSIVDDINIMEAGGTTQRGRHFFRVLLLQEMFLGFDHLNEASGDFTHDVFGRPVIRGNTYDLLKQCEQDMAFLKQDTSLPDYAHEIASSTAWLCQSWAELDDVVWNTTVLRYFTNIGAPPPK